MKKYSSELRNCVSVEKFELIFKDFMAQAKDNVKTGKSNGKKKSIYLDNNDFDGAKLLCQYGQGHATATPHINWWVLSIYYLPVDENIIMGIEDYRYPYIDKLHPKYFKSVGNKKDPVAVFYETVANELNYAELYEHFINVSEQIMELGVVDYNTIKKR